MDEEGPEIPWTMADLLGWTICKRPIDDDRCLLVIAISGGWETVHNVQKIDADFDIRDLRVMGRPLDAEASRFMADFLNMQPPSEGVTMSDFPAPGTEAFGIMNRRRVELIRKKNRMGLEGLTYKEKCELHKLQVQVSDAIENASPRRESDRALIEEIRREIESDPGNVYVSMEKMPEPNTPAWDVMNTRRGDLIWRDVYQKNLTHAEKAELEWLQEESGNAMSKAFPRGDTKKLLRELDEIRKSLESNKQ